MTFKTIILKKQEKEHIATITLNRPEKMNAITPEMNQELMAAFEDIDGDDDIRVLILTGAGERAFCAGADVGGMPGGDRELNVPSDKGLSAVYENLCRSWQKIPLMIQRLSKPTIAMVNGVAVGGGFNLALACDIRVGSSKARFMVAFTRLGVVLDLGGSWLMPRVMGLSKAAELIYTGEFVDAEEAARIGILDKLVAPNELEAATLALASKIAKGPPIANKLNKLLLYQGLQTDLETQLKAEAIYQMIPLSSQDHIEGVKAVREKREALFQGR